MRFSNSHNLGGMNIVLYGLCKKEPMYERMIEMKTKLNRTTAITEIGESIQIRIQYEDSERLKKLKQSPEEPWYVVVHNVLMDNARMKKELSENKGRSLTSLSDDEIMAKLKSDYP